MFPASSPPPRRLLVAAPTPASPCTSILSATLTAHRSSSTLLSSVASKGKLGFSIDSIVGNSNSNNSNNRSDVISTWSAASSSSSPPARDRSPLSRPDHFSPSASPPPVSPPLSSDYGRRSPPPSPHFHHNRSSDSSPPPPPASPPQRSLVRPIPTTTGGGALLGSPQSYLDQLASLKAFYESTASRSAHHPSPHNGPPLLHPGLLPPGLHPMLSGLQRPGGGLFLGGGQPQHHPAMPPHLPREYPLYPWFIHRHRFPGGEFGILFILYTVLYKAVIKTAKST